MVVAVAGPTKRPTKYRSITSPSGDGRRTRPIVSDRSDVQAWVSD